MEELYTWGCGCDGKLGHGDQKTYVKPKLVDAMVGKMPQQVACGGSHTVVRTEDGKVFSFGSGWNGQLGHGHHNTILTPRLVEAFDGHFIVQVSL